MNAKRCCSGLTPRLAASIIRTACIRYAAEPQTIVAEYVPIGGHEPFEICRKGEYIVNDACKPRGIRCNEGGRVVPVDEQLEGGFLDVTMLWSTLADLTMTALQHVREDTGFCHKLFWNLSWVLLLNRTLDGCDSSDPSTLRILVAVTLALSLRSEAIGKKDAYTKQSGAVEVKWRASAYGAPRPLLSRPFLRTRHREQPREQHLVQHRQCSRLC